MDPVDVHRRMNGGGTTHSRVRLCGELQMIQQVSLERQTVPWLLHAGVLAAYALK